MKNNHNQFLPNEAIENQVKYDLMAYQKILKKQITWPIDIENFIESVWGLNINYEDNITYPGTDDVIIGYLSVKNNEVLINLSENTTDGRINFSLGHEAGHASLHSTLGAYASDSSNNEIYCRATQEGFQKIEYQANYYSTNLLLPKEEIFNEMSGEESIDMNTKGKELIDKYKVSRQFLELRLAKLGFKIINNKYNFTKI